MIATPTSTSSRARKSPSSATAAKVTLTRSTCATAGSRKSSQGVKKAEAERFRVMEVAEAARWADVMMMLTPDELQADIYTAHLAGNMKQGAALMFAHGL